MLFSRSIKHFCCLLLMVFLCTSILAFQSKPVQAGDGTWTQVGPEGGNFIDIAVNPYDDDHIFAVVADGLFHSTDGGHHWSELPTPLCQVPEEIEKNRLKIGGTENNLSLLFDYCDRLFLSTFPSISWQQIAPISPYTGSFEISRTDPLKMVVESSYKLLASPDGGETWNQVYGITDHLAMDVTNPDHLLINSDGAIFFSDDFGLHWTLIKNIQGIFWPEKNIIGFSETNSEIYIGNMDEIYISTDYGQSWVTKIFPTNYAYNFVFSPGSSNTFIVNQYITTDGGDTWAELPSKTETGSLINKFIFANAQPVEFFAATKDSFTRIQSDGSLVFESASCIEKLSVKRLIMNSGNPSEMYFQSDQWYYTNNAGESWTKFSADSVLAIGDRNSFCHIYTVNEYFTKFYHSNDCGQTFELLIEGYQEPINADYMIIDPTQENILYAELFDSLYVSYDGGKHWARRFMGLDNSTSILPDQRVSGSLYYLSHNFRRSSDGGATWEQFPAPYNDLYSVPRLASIYYNGTTHLLSWLDGEAWVSQDRGETWQLEGEWTNSNEPEGVYVQLSSYFVSGSGEAVVLADANGTKMYSFNYGNDWLTLPPIPQVSTSPSTNLSKIDTSAFADGFRICSGTDSRGVYCIDIHGNLRNRLYLPLTIR